MTTTDRAFIAALQQSDASSSSSSSSAPASTIRGKAARFDTPHSGFQGYESSPKAKAPLSEHLAKRKAETLADHRLRPGVEVDAFAWPTIIADLAEQARQPLLDTLSQVSTSLSSTETPLLCLVGARPGVGTTSTLLAMAHLIAGIGGRVAIVDATRDHGAATLLGVRRVAHLDRSFDPLSIDDLLVTSRGCGTSILAVGAPCDSIAGPAAERLAATHDLVLVDAADPSAWLRCVSPERSAALLIDTAGDTAEDTVGDPSEHRVAAQRSALGAGYSFAGLVETLVA